MWQLITASLIWAFSFGLIGTTLQGLPPAWLAAIRLLIAALIFIPFTRPIPPIAALRLTLVGTIQFGIMYLLYMSGFATLKSHEIILFTTTTPLYITLFNDLANRSFNLRNHFGALLAVTGAVLVLWHGSGINHPLQGFLLIQLSNIAFAAGQLGYRRLYLAHSLHIRKDHQLIFWLYLGGTLALLPLAAIDTIYTSPAMTPKQWGVLLYLGVVASGIGFLLWNSGTRRVTTRTLAAMNNLKIPLGVSISLLIFGEHANWINLAAGTLLIIAGTRPAKNKNDKQD